MDEAGAVSPGANRTADADSAARLKVARKALGLSDSQMAAALGLRGANAKDDYRRMETGARPVSGPVLVAAEALVRIRDLETRLRDGAGQPKT